MKFRYFFLLFLAIFLASACQSINVNQNMNQPIGLSGVGQQQEETESTSSPEANPPLGKIPKTESGEVLDVEVEKIEVEVPKTEIPNFLDYSVAFVPQAPYQVWDELHKEACEEAAMITVVKYFMQEEVNAHTAEQAILNLVNWEKENGYLIDLTAVETAEILKKHFNLDVELKTGITIENIKQELKAGRLIIVPAAGRRLDNPNFKTPGPIYHMLVIRGYDDKTGEFITNDPGTRKGEGYRYKYQKLIDAIHDWDHDLAEGGMTDEEMEQGRKVMIVVSN